ncbi:MAG: tetratricopeptide repeat protein [Bdellovibrionales bacterium]|jgi:TolA-binding protein|nr:tetratricopeptide repeat protein [Bdellovibrionales bacterium]
MKRIIGFFSIFVLTSSCLQTRTEVKEVEQRQVMQQQVSTIQKNTADASSRFVEIEEQMRTLNGRVEVVENQIQRENQLIQSHSKANTEKFGEVNKKSELLQDSIEKMEQQIFSLQAEVTKLHSEYAAFQAANQTKPQANSPSKPVKSTFDVAQEQFAKKDWKQAILSYQKYREENPKGKSLALATLRIGASFQELGLKDEAVTFYKEVLSKYPKSEEAKKAKTRLKSPK